MHLYMTQKLNICLYQASVANSKEVPFFVKCQKNVKKRSFENRFFLSPKKNPKKMQT